MDGHVRNFGDSLYEVIAPWETRRAWSADTTHMYFPIGSVICDEVIQETLNQNLVPVFYHCGWRGEEIDPGLASLCKFKGARGPHTKEALARAGVEVEVTQDPAYRLPGLVSPGEPNGLSILMRHIEDPADYNVNTIFEYQVDAMFSPVVESVSDIIEVVEKISGARFVLTGSLHAAIVAHAYKVPFALLGADYINCPAKWGDWLASEGLGEPVWVSNLSEGREWYNSVVRDKERGGGHG